MQPFLLLQGRLIFFVARKKKIRYNKQEGKLIGNGGTNKCVC